MSKKEVNPLAETFLYRKEVLSMAEKEFIPKKDLFKKDGFTIAWGEWHENGVMTGECTGERWDRYPMGRGGKETWLVRHDELTIPTLKSLIGLPGVDTQAVLDILKKLL